MFRNWRIEINYIKNEIKVCRVLFYIVKPFNYFLPISPMTYTFKNFLRLELILSRITLLSFPDSPLAGLIRRHFRLFSKFSLWSLSETSASCFFNSANLQFVWNVFQFIINLRNGVLWSVFICSRYVVHKLVICVERCL
jgi:hypothetical protein